MRAGFAEEAPSSELEEAQQLAAALAASQEEQNSAGGPATQPPVSVSAAGGVHFVASLTTVYVAAGAASSGSGSADAAQPAQEPEPEAPAAAAAPSSSSASSSSRLASGGDPAAVAAHYQKGDGVTESLSGIPLTAAQRAARRIVGESRLVRAAVAGWCALEKKLGLIQAVPRTPELQGAASERRLFILIRGIPGCELIGLAPFRYSQFQGYVEVNNRIHPRAIFHGFASQAEALEYWQAVFGNLPWPLLAPRP